MKKSLFLPLLLLLGFAADASAQEWVSTGGPGGGTATVVDMISPPDGSIVAITESELWHSDSLQSNWKKSGFQFQNERPKFVIDSNHNILMLQSFLTYNSTNMGKTWSGVIAGFSLGGHVTAAVVERNNIICLGTEGSGLYISGDCCRWYSVNGIVTPSIFSLSASRDSVLYASGTYQGQPNTIFRSFDNGKTSAQLRIIVNSQVRGDGEIDCMQTNIYGDLFAFINPSSAGFPDMYRSTDKGATWSFFNKGLNCSRVNSMIELPDGSITAATDSGIFILPLEGCEWMPYSIGLWTKNVLSIACNSKGELFAGSDSSGVFKSTKLFNDTLMLTGLIDPSGPVNYETLQTGSTSCQDVILRNRGVNPFTIQSYTAVDPAPFSLSDESAKKLPITLNPNDSVIMSICFHPPQPAVYASSIIWNTDIDPSLCGINRETELHGVAIQKSSVQTSSPEEIKFSLHPNPSSGNSVTISFSEAPSQTVAISVYDVLGREVYRNNIMPGSKEFDIPIRDLSEGIYYARIELNGKIATEQFVKMK
jgi:hypothetical protein